MSVLASAFCQGEGALHAHSGRQVLHGVRATLAADLADYLDRFIEVKTTRYGRHTPFYISDGELRFSEEHAESYYLYRLFGFRKSPLLFTLPGDVGRHVQLQPVNYRAQF